MNGHKDQGITANGSTSPDTGASPKEVPLAGQWCYMLLSPALCVPARPLLFVYSLLKLICLQLILNAKGQAMFG